MRDILFEKTCAEAEKGDAKAQYTLGVLYHYGNGVAQDHKVAEQWFRKAAAQGHALAQERLGVLYPEGQGVARDDEERKKQEKVRHAREVHAPEQQIEKFLQENKSLLNKFLEIAESKVSRLDAYGDEHWKALPQEILIWIEKLGETTQGDPGVRQQLDRELRQLAMEDSQRRRGPRVKWWERNLTHLRFFSSCYSQLKTRFENYHDAQKKRPKSDVEIWKGMSGMQFEAHVAELLKDKGYGVRGTPVVGDQGADLIAIRNGKKIIIQVKKYTNASVGNEAVQQVAAARNHYRGDEAWVITNSVFTQGAKDLAWTNAVRLINGDMLKKNNF